MSGCSSTDTYPSSPLSIEVNCTPCSSPLTPCSSPLNESNEQNEPKAETINLLQSTLSQFDLLQFSPQLKPISWGKLQSYIKEKHPDKEDVFELKDAYIDKDSTCNTICFWAKKPEVILNDILLLFCTEILDDDPFITLYCRSSLMCNVRNARDGYAIISLRIKQAQEKALAQIETNRLEKLNLAVAYDDQETGLSIPEPILS